MDMVMLPWINKGVEFNTRVLRREESRPAVPLLSPGPTRADRMVTMCSGCRKVATPDWVEAEEAIPILHLFEQSTMPHITHGICGDCYAMARASIDQAPES